MDDYFERLCIQLCNERGNLSLHVPDDPISMNDFSQSDPNYFLRRQDTINVNTLGLFCTKTLHSHNGTLRII